jgi:hypothetical protein
MKIELKTNNLKEIVQICKNNNIELKHAKIDTKIWTNLSSNKDYVKLYLIYKKK